MILFILSVAESNAQEKKTKVGLRLLSDYSFSKTANQDTYGDNAQSMAIDVIFPSENRNLLWRMSFELLISSGDYYISPTRGQTKLNIVGLAGAALYHAPLTKAVRLYGGAGLGYYDAIEERTTDKSDGGNLGFNFFGGANFALSEDLSLGLEYNIRKLSVYMSSTSGRTRSRDENYGGSNLFLVFNMRL
jgi:opacity protein-like surface antigen